MESYSQYCVLPLQREVSKTAQTTNKTSQDFTGDRRLENSEKACDTEKWILWNINYSGKEIFWVNMTYKICTQYDQAVSSVKHVNFLIDCRYLGMWNEKSVDFVRIHPDYLFSDKKNNPDYEDKNALTRDGICGSSKWKHIYHSKWIVKWFENSNCCPYWHKELTLFLQHDSNSKLIYSYTPSVLVIPSPACRAEAHCNTDNEETKDQSEPITKETLKTLKNNFIYEH